MHIMLIPVSLPEAVLLASLILSVALVLSARILARKQVAAPTSPPVPFLAAPPPLPAEAFPVEPSGIPVRPDTRLEVGSAVLASWQGCWWRAEVIGLEPGQRVKIHYLGWDNMWDESVPRSALQMDLSSSIEES
jgi:hypothetical protein